MPETTTIEICEKCRKIRLATVFTFMISSALAGVFWANVGQASDRATLAWAVAFTVLSVALILAIEVVVTRVERESKRLYLQLKERTEEVRILKETLQRSDQSIDLLSDDNRDVREQLLEESVYRTSN